MRLYMFGGPVSYEAKLYTSIFACVCHIGLLLLVFLLLCIIDHRVST